MPVTLKPKAEQHVSQFMSWLVQSEDLNPIERVWYETDRKVRARQPKNAAHL